MKRLPLFALSCFISCFASAQDFNSAAESIVPHGVRLGMATADLKQARPTVYEGPSPSLPGGRDAKTYRSLMELQGMGAPGHLSYWYLCSHEKVVGVLRTRSLIGTDAGASKEAAQQTYRGLAEQLGSSGQETLLRKGATAFVPVRADVWRSKEGRAVYYIATDHELTVAVVEPSDFPLDQVFIRPDPQRFPMEEPSQKSIADLERPVTIATSGVPALHVAPTTTTGQMPEVEPPRESTTPTPESLSASTPVPASPSKAVGNASGILLLVLASAAVIVIAFLLMRRRGT